MPSALESGSPERSTGEVAAHGRPAPAMGQAAAEPERLSRMGTSPVDRWEAANRGAAERVLASDPWLVGVRPAGEVVPGLAPDMILHAGPPAPWETMSDLLRGGLVGAALFEGLAGTPAEAEAKAAAGQIRFAAAQDHARHGRWRGLDHRLPAGRRARGQSNGSARLSLSHGGLRAGAHPRHVRRGGLRTACLVSG